MHSMPGLPLLHSRDLVNWEFLGYPLERLDLGPAFRIEDGKNVYGQGIWAPCLRFHKELFTSSAMSISRQRSSSGPPDPAGPWMRTHIKRRPSPDGVLFPR